MTKIRFDSKAQALARKTGLDKLGQSTLKKIDADSDGVIKLKDAKALIEKAGLETDGVLGRDDRKAIQAALGETRSTKAPRASGGGTQGVLGARLGSAGRKSAKLADGYLQHDLKRVRDGVKVELTFTPDDERGIPQTDKKTTRSLVLHGLDARAIEVQAFGAKGQTGLGSSTMLHDNVRFEGSSAGAGLLVGIADAARGVVIADVVGKDFIDGATPEQRTLLSPEKLAKEEAVLAEAKKHKLDPKSLSVSVESVSFSDGYKQPNVLTLALELKLVDGKGKSHKAEVSGYLRGNLSKGVSGLKVSGLESGVMHSYGWLYPPSMLKTSSDRADGENDARATRKTGNFIEDAVDRWNGRFTSTGGSESSARELRRTLDGGNYWGGGE